MNEKFYSLPEEKRLRILNAAMEVFGRNDYKRASTDLIAAKAGVSKGLLFYYFHNKKELYLYLYDYVTDVMTKRIVNQKFLEITDFFELLTYAAREKVQILEKNPYILEFAVKVFYSEKEEVSDALRETNIEQMGKVYGMYFERLDLQKFRDDADPVYVYKMLVWMADGYMHEQKMRGKQLEVNAMMQEFECWMHMLRTLTYKEEYLDEYRECK